MVPRTLFSPEHETFRDSVRRFLEAEVKPHDERWQEQGYADKAVWQKAGENGFLCMSMPEAIAKKARQPVHRLLADHGARR